MEKEKGDSTCTSLVYVYCLLFPGQKTIHPKKKCTKHLQINLCSTSKKRLCWDCMCLLSLIESWLEWIVWEDPFGPGFCWASSSALAALAHWPPAKPSHHWDCSRPTSLNETHTSSRWQVHIFAIPVWSLWFMFLSWVLTTLQRDDNKDEQSINLFRLGLPYTPTQS